MKTEKLFEAFTELDDDLIENALPKEQDYDEVKPALKIHSWKPWVAGAAVAAAALGVVFAGFKLFGSGKIGFSPTVESSSAADNAKYSEMMVDWAVYDSAEELVENSDIICKAKVNDITFALIDPKTGEEIEDGDNPKNGELCTIYDIYLTKVYKSNVINKGRLWFRVMGGIKGYKTDEQLEVLKRAGSDTIPVMHEPPEIELGGEYLFLLTGENGYTCLTNAPQGVYPLSNPAYRDEFSNASAQDIIDCIESQTLDLSSIVYADKLENENPHYSAEEIVKNEEVICTGTVKNISFAVLDLDTCLPPTESSVDYKVNLFTIYDIELKNSYKGNVAKSFKLVDIGGIKGYKVGEQLEALDNEFLKDKNTIPVWSDPPDIKIGEEYLFVMRHSDIEKPCFFGHHKQTAFPLSDPAFRDEYSGASVKDIINLAENTAAVDNYAELSITHNNNALDLSKIDRDKLIAAIQDEMTTNCTDGHAITRLIDKEIKDHSETGYVIDLVYNDIDAPLAGGGNDKKAMVICHTIVIIGADNEESLITISYTDLSVDGASEERFGGTYILSAICRNQLLGCIGECSLSHNDCINQHNATHSPECLFDYFYDPSNMPLQDAIFFTLPEYPGVEFQWTHENVMAISDDKYELFMGMPVYGVYLCDLDGDGKREICSTVSIGSGIIDDRILAYNYANGNLYELQDRGTSDYALTVNDGVLCYVQNMHSVSSVVTKPLTASVMTCHTDNSGFCHGDLAATTTSHHDEPEHTTVTPTPTVTTGTHHSEHDETHH